MWSIRKRKSGSRLGHDKRGIPAFDTVSLHSNLGSPRRNYLSIITTDINVLHFGSKASKRLLKIRHWWLKNKERKVVMADGRIFSRSVFLMFLLHYVTCQHNISRGQRSGKGCSHYLSSKRVGTDGTDHVLTRHRLLLWKIGGSHFENEQQQESFERSS